MQVWKLDLDSIVKETEFFFSSVLKEGKRTSKPEKGLLASAIPSNY